ncbi:GNAT family N-acetyltransferase [Streptacidiphilus jiangxiensis]|uniref:Acetyltransferase (GNAT) family protein n=1 Tax=Streptacidiphilus jiangxiensis TaxID=235985 RepID=A0A1H7N8F9_STRJI|nr:GNAT family N-acetyltransferase [Streptacidiphilus jiangxiensis]SEL19764.1 Acetyltransferase (GNAT) family protein [Streptacidiphilus jiangxiensis]
MRFRPTTPADLDRVLPLVADDPACTMTADGYRARLATRQYRPERTWIAERESDGAPLAVAVWWAGPDDDLPRALDGVFVHPVVEPAQERIALAAELLGAAHAAFAQAGVEEPPAYHFFLPGDWNERPEVTAAVAWRREASRRAGLTVTLERLRYEWAPSDGLPQPSQRLSFHAEPDDEVFVDLFRRVLEGTLDTDSRKDADRIGADAQARRDVAFYRDMMPGERSWWRIARSVDGETVGFGLPSRNPDSAVVGYLGVLPPHRGHGYADDILAEITRFLAVETAAPRIRADTDLTNTPMAAAFTRQGYRNFSRRLVLSAH